MSTEYRSYPPLAGWLRAAQLIATAKVIEIEQLPKKEADDDRREALARLALGQVIKGAPSSKEITLRFVETEAHPYGEKGEILLMAVPDVGPDIRKDTYVAYLGAALPFDGKGVALPVGRDGRGRVLTEMMTLDRLQEAVASFQATEQERRKLTQELENADRFDPAPEATELPALDVPGPIDLAPQREAE